MGLLAALADEGGGPLSPCGNLLGGQQHHFLAGEASGQRCVRGGMGSSCCGLQGGVGATPLRRTLTRLSQTPSLHCYGNRKGGFLLGSRKAVGQFPRKEKGRSLRGGSWDSGSLVSSAASQEAGLGCRDG